MSVHEGCLDRTAIQSLVGLSSTDTISVYGVTPVAQASAITAVSTSAGITGAIGFTATQAAALLTAVNSLITALKNYGITA